VCGVIPALSAKLATQDRWAGRIGATHVRDK